MYHSSYNFLNLDSYQMDAEHPDHALIWNLQLLSQVLHKVGSSIHMYTDQLLPCLQKCVHLKSKQAFSHASSVSDLFWGGGGVKKQNKHTWEGRIFDCIKKYSKYVQNFYKPWCELFLFLFFDVLIYFLYKAVK